MKESKMIAQKIIHEGRNQQGTGLISWEDTASHIIEGYKESAKLDALQAIIKFIEDREEAYENLLTGHDNAGNHFFKGYLEAMYRVKKEINRIKSPQPRKQNL